jgi:hypothetical protein
MKSQQYQNSPVKSTLRLRLAARHKINQPAWQPVNNKMADT